MERLKKFNKLLILGFILYGIIVSKGYAGDVDFRYMPIYTFKDDRDVSNINNNFQRVTANIIDDKAFNVPITSGSTFTNVTLNNVQRSNEYIIFVQATWDAVPRILQKATTGFLLTYTAPTTTVETVDWILVK